MKIYDDLEDAFAGFAQRCGQLINLKCKKTCDIDTWCICEAVETIETKIEYDINDLSKKEKRKYIDKLYEKLNNQLMKVV